MSLIDIVRLNGLWHRRLCGFVTVPKGSTFADREKRKRVLLLVKCNDFTFLKIKTFSVKMGAECMTGWEVTVIGFLSAAVMGDQTLCVVFEEMMILGNTGSILLKYVCLA